MKFKLLFTENVPIQHRPQISFTFAYILFKDASYQVNINEIKCHWFLHVSFGPMKFYFSIIPFYFFPPIFFSNLNVFY